MEPCQQTDRIERIERAVEGLTGQVAQIVTDVRVVRDLVENIGKQTSEHEEILMGKGMQQGLVSLVMTSVKIMEDLKNALKGEGDKPGLIGTVSNLAEKVDEIGDSRKWITRLVIGWVITAIAAGVLLAGK